MRDVGADVVAADQALAAGAGDLDGLHRDVHDLGLVQHRQHDRAGEGHIDLADLGDDERFALFDLAEQAADDDRHPQPYEQHDGEEHAEP